MANNYEQVTAAKTITCTQEEADKLKEILEKAEEEDDICHGFTFDYGEPHGDQLYLYAEENGTPGALPDEALDLIGELVKKNNLPYLEFGYAVTCSRMIVGEFGGGQFRIYPDGSLVFPTIVWPEGVE